MRPLVYLCGTITQDPKHLEWRKQATAMLADYGIDTLSPVRGKNPNDWRKDGLDSTNTPYASGGFVARDKRDVARCDAVLLAFWEPLDRQSIGTWWEAGWASEMGKPIVVCSELPEVVEHPFVWRQAAKICPTLDDAVEYLVFLLGD